MSLGQVSMHKGVLLFALGAGIACSLSACGKSSATKTPSPKWTLSIGRARHPLALGADGTIYALLDTGVLIAIDPSGNTKWSRQAAAIGKLAIGPAIGSDGAIYVTGHNRLVVFDQAGTVRDDIPLGTSAAAAGMALTSNRVYTQCMRAGICAFNLQGGPNFLWHVSQEGPAPIVQSDGTVVFGYESVVAIRSSPESPQWIYPKGGSLVPDDEHPAWFDVSPMGYAHVGTDGLSASADGTTYVTNPNDLTALDASGQVKWQFVSPSIPGLQAVLAADGTIYYASSDRHLYALHPDGKVRWKVSTTALLGQPLVGSAGTVFFMDERTLRAIGPDGSDKWKMDLDSEVLTFNADGISTLSDDGTLYIASRLGTLYAIPVGESLALSAWPKFQANVRNSGQVNHEPAVGNP